MERDNQMHGKCADNTGVQHCSTPDKPVRPRRSFSSMFQLTNATSTTQQSASFIQLLDITRYRSLAANRSVSFVQEHQGNQESVNIQQPTGVRPAKVLKPVSTKQRNVRKLTRIQPVNALQQPVNVVQSANPLSILRHTNPASFRQPTNDRYCTNISQPTNLEEYPQNSGNMQGSLKCYGTREELILEQFRNIQQRASFQQPTNDRQCTNISQPTNLEEYPQNSGNMQGSLKCYGTREELILERFRNIQQRASFQQPTNDRQCTNISQPTNLEEYPQNSGNMQGSWKDYETRQELISEQLRNIKQRASFQQPTNDRQCTNISQPTNLEEHRQNSGNMQGSLKDYETRQELILEQLENTQQPASVQNSALVQDLATSRCFDSSRHRLPKDVLVTLLSREKVQELVKQKKLKVDESGHLKVCLQKNKIRFVSNHDVLQTLNQRPGQSMNMPGMQNKMPSMGMMSAQTGGPMGHMGPIQTMQSNAMLTQINQMGQGNMPQQMNQMVPAQMGQLSTGQMQPNMQTQMQNQLPGQMGNQIGGPIGGIQTSMPQQMNQIGPGQLGPSQMQQQLNHIQRKSGEMMSTGFPGPRNVAPNQFLRQSPSPSAPSPAGLGAPSSNQMVASPALVPSPSPQHSIMTGPSRSVNSVGMAPSPSSSLNTPGGVGATPSPQQEDQAYRDKVRQLSKYIEPLRRMIAKMSSEGNVDKLSKMKKLLEILSSPNKRMPLDTLLKCEVVLEKLDFKRGDGSVGPPVTTLKEHQIFSPLLEAVSAHAQSPVFNHTLQRTFGPCLGALFAPEIKNLPPPLPKQKVEEPPNEIPDALQGEIARLDQRFKVSLDPAQQNGSKCIQLICWLDDRHLPCVPPVSVTVPADYPLTPPRCVMAPHEYEATTFLCAVQRALNARIAKLPRRFSLSQLLDTWEVSVRQASGPTPVTVSS